ncbi:ABC transporter permease [Marispirochaeta aestuarii]|uniref:ABC transporter permease n=1 Tax=Marispirochaeta aestuarii TaxID=1963862 RepID=UPI002ABDE3FA|nr:ABC transporter permease [Marispirochaeta aestuarii]
MNSKKDDTTGGTGIIQATESAGVKEKLIAFFRKLLIDHNYILSLILLLIIGRIASDQFLTVASLMNLLKSSVFIGIIALGMSMVILSGNIDLSVGSMLALSASIGVVVFNSTTSIFLSLIAAVSMGFILGLFNGFFIGVARVAAFIVTLATLVGYRSITIQFGHGGPLIVDNDAYFKLLRPIGYGKLGPVPYLVILFILVSIAVWFLMTKTKFGRYVYAVGSNERAARLTGINVRLVKVAIFTLTGVLTGVAGFLYITRFGSVDVSTAGKMFELDVIAAVAIGGIAMSGGRGHIQGSFFGAVILYAIDAILSAFSVPAFVNDLIKGILILGAVLMQKALDKERSE